MGLHSPIQEAHEGTVVRHRKIADRHCHDDINRATEDMSVLRILEGHVGARTARQRRKSDAAAAAA